MKTDLPVFVTAQTLSEFLQQDYRTVKRTHQPCAYLSTPGGNKPLYNLAEILNQTQKKK